MYSFYGGAANMRAALGGQNTSYATECAHFFIFLYTHTHSTHICGWKPYLQILLTKHVNKAKKIKLLRSLILHQKKVCTFCGIYERLFKMNSMIQTRLSLQSVAYIIKKKKH